ncbi:MAG TPA: hypothetical protein VF933_15010 [Streptosporangiaceae bacterium]
MIRIHLGCVLCCSPSAADGVPMMIGPAVARVAAVIPGSLLVLFVGLLWLLALPCSEERHRYVEAITVPAMETARTLFHGGARNDRAPRRIAK